MRDAAPITDATQTRFAGRFQCIGPACEDSCCSFGWRIALDRQDYSRLKAALSGTSGERARFRRGCARTEGAGVRDGNFATLQRTPGGACVFLSPVGWCSVQESHGPEALPGVCATYPRIVTRSGDRASLTCALSCPEAARLCLLAEDAMIPEPADPTRLDGLRPRSHVPSASRAPLARNFLSVRGAFLELLARQEYPVSSRLRFALNLAERLDAATEVPGARSSDAQIAAVLRACLAGETLDRLHRECRAVTARSVAPFAVAQQVVHALLSREHAARLASLVDAVYAPRPGEEVRPSRPAAGSRPAGRAPRATRSDELLATYERSRLAWEGAFGGRIARSVANYAANFWLQEPFTTSADLVTHVWGLLARVAAIRFLLFTHPALRRLDTPAAADSRRADALDRAIVEVAYLVSRAAEHGEDTGALLQGVLAEHRVRGRRRALELAKF